MPSLLRKPRRSITVLVYPEARKTATSALLDVVRDALSRLRRQPPECFGRHGQSVRLHHGRGVDLAAHDVESRDARRSELAGHRVAEVRLRAQLAVPAALGH